MKYSIENLQHHYSDEFGNNLMIITFDFHFTEPEEIISAFNPMAMHLLDKYIKETYPAFSNYMQRTWESLDTFGSQTALVFEAIGEEARQQYYGYAHEFLLLHPEWAVTMYEHEKKYPRNKERQERLAAMAEKLEEQEPQLAAIKKARQLEVEFKTKVQRALRSIAVEVYPQIMKFSPERIKELQDLFTNDILLLELTLQRYFRRINEE